MKIKKKLLAIPACLALMTTSAHSALILEFNQVGLNVELTFSGEVDLADSYLIDAGNSQGGYVSRIGVSGFGLVEKGMSNKFTTFEYFSGTNLLTVGLGNSVLGDAAIGLMINSSDVFVGVGIDGGVTTTNGNDVKSISAKSGGVLFGKKQTFVTSYKTSGLNKHKADTLINMWRVTGTTGTDNLIQFRVNSVPEPSSSLLSALAGLVFLTRRKR